MKRLESSADEILSKLGRMDRMLDHVVDGNADCPRLFVLTPVEGSQEVRTLMMLVQPKLATSFSFLVLFSSEDRCGKIQRLCTF